MTLSKEIHRIQDEYAHRDQRLAQYDPYSLFNSSSLFIYQQLQRNILSILAHHNLKALRDLRILELGCGRGGILLEYLAYGAQPNWLHGCDLILERVYMAHHILPHLPVICADGQHLPYASASFDLALQYTVFTSILDMQTKRNLAQEMLRVLKPGGLILWYDFWLNPSNPQTRGIRPAEIRSLFAGCRFTFKRITLAPPVARRLVPFSWLLCAFLEKLKIFNTHYLVGIQK